MPKAKQPKKAPFDKTAFVFDTPLDDIIAGISYTEKQRRRS